MYRNVDELEELITAFEQGTLPISQWDHAAHLAVAIWYLNCLPEHEATQAFIAGILRYNRINEIDVTDRGGYNETLTLFWLTIAQRCQDDASPGTSLLDLTNEFIRRFGEKKLLFLEYYSEELIWSWRARQAWIEPDLKSIDECFC